MPEQFAGVQIGHATDDVNHTGCTVLLCPPNTLASVEARGPAPGSREFALLGSDKPEDKPVNALVLTGGSAFGLAAVDGVMRYLSERGIGWPTPIRPVPIVPAAVVFDLGLGDPLATPGPDMGYGACEACVAADAGAVVPQGNVGAGAGVTVGKWAGFPNLMKGGFGAISLTEGDLVVGAVAVVNAVGDVVNPDGTVLAGARDPEGGWMADKFAYRYVDPSLLPGWATNTTLVVAMTNARLSQSQLLRLAQQANNGMAIAIRPVHTRHDGDVAFGLATGEVEAPEMLVMNMAVAAVSEAIRNAVRYSHSVLGIPGLAGEAGHEQRQ